MPTIEPMLSILVPSLPQRYGMLTMLMRRLEKQVGDLPVEILALTDNKRRSVGLKRQALLDIARGRFVTFVDDDDSVFPGYVDEILLAIHENPDVSTIVFDQLTEIEGYKPFLIRFGLEFQNEEAQPTTEVEPEMRVFHRKPWHVCPWRRDIAQRCVFPDASYGEDSYWVDQCCQLATSQYRIHKTLHMYKFSPSVTAAEHVFPEGPVPAPLPGPRSQHAPFPLR